MKLALIVLIFPLFACAQPQQAADTLMLFFLGGQSNMEGYGINTDLPPWLNRTFDNTWIFQGNPAGDDMTGGGTGLWEMLRPGHGTGFTSDGKVNNHSEHFGVELSFADRLSELYPGKKIAIIKYARGGSSIDSLAAGDFGCWDPDFHGKTGINQYDHYLATVRNATAVTDIDGDGRVDVLKPCGIVWMQGESDAFWTEEIASKYYKHMVRLMDLMRASFRTDDLPVVFGKITDSGEDEDGKVWAYCHLVQHAQEKYAASDGNASIVRTTLSYKYSDPYHYDSRGYMDLGKQFAEELDSLMK